MIWMKMWKAAAMLTLCEPKSGLSVEALRNSRLNRLILTNSYCLYRFAYQMKLMILSYSVVISDRKWMQHIYLACGGRDSQTIVFVHCKGRCNPRRDSIWCLHFNCCLPIWSTDTSAMKTSTTTTTTTKTTTTTCRNSECHFLSTYLKYILLIIFRGHIYYCF